MMHDPKETERRCKIREQFELHHGAQPPPPIPEHERIVPNFSTWLFRGLVWSVAFHALALSYWWPIVWAFFGLWMNTTEKRMQQQRNRKYIETRIMELLHRTPNHR